MPPAVGVGVAVVITDVIEVLMIERGGAHGAGTWSVPGGWVEKGEDPVEAAVREVREEVGLRLDVERLRFLGYTHSVHDETVEDVCLWFCFDFEPELEGLRPSIEEPDKITGLAWKYWDALPEPLFLGFRQALKKGLLPV